MLALTFALIRRFPEYHKNQMAHCWKSAGNIISVEGSTVLVLGIGDIGGDYARKMKALGAAMRHWNPPGRPRKNRTIWMSNTPWRSWDSVLGRADIVAMVLPGGEATCHLMDERRLGLMKKGAYLVNVGRGNAIDPDALYRALISGQLAGCGLDVTEPEPLPAESPLWDLDQMLITPHVAGNFFLSETFERIVRIAGENLKAWANHEPFRNVVDRRPDIDWKIRKWLKGRSSGRNGCLVEGQKWLNEKRPAFCGAPA